MQVISARLGVVTGKDLAQCCRDWYPAWTRWPNWLLSELAIGACDLAEVLGSAVALNLLFHIPLFWAVIITGLDVLLLLALQRFGMRTIEAVVLVLVGTIAVCYFIEIFVLPQTQPSFLEMGARADVAALPAGRNAVRRHRHHRRDRDAAQPVPALGAGAEPQAAEGRAVDAQRHPLQHHRFGGGADDRVLRERGDPGAGGDGVLRQGERHRAGRPGRTLQRRQRLDSRRLPDAGAAAGHDRREHAVRRGAAGQRTEQHHHRHARRPGGDGRLHALAHQAVGAAADHAHAGDPCRRSSSSACAATAASPTC